MDESQKMLRAALLQTVNKQIRGGDPAATRETFERLQREGYSPKDAKLLIANVLLAELGDISNQQKPFDEARYTGGLNRLPEMPWDDEEEDV
jgi:hypothetical protein